MHWVFLSHGVNIRQASNRYSSTVCDIYTSTLRKKYVQFRGRNHVITRQLPMGAGHCPWGGYTDRIVCNIHGEEHLASRCRAMLRPGTFGKFGILPSTLATCQYCETFLDGACFGLGILANLASCQPLWQPASTGRPF